VLKFKNIEFERNDIIISGERISLPNHKVFNFLYFFVISCVKKDGEFDIRHMINISCILFENTGIDNDDKKEMLEYLAILLEKGFGITKKKMLNYINII